MKKISLRLVVSADFIPSFYPLLGKGFQVCTELGLSIKEFLCRQIGLSPDYVENSIQTLFLDGKAVDTPDSAIIRDGSVLALSGAMPGLAGATLRRGGFYGGMRGEISHGGETFHTICGEGYLTVKLFNLILKQTGAKFLKNGILINGEDLNAILTAQSNRLHTKCRAAELDGKSIDPNTLTGIKWNGVTVFLQIQSQKDEG